MRTCSGLKKDCISPCFCVKLLAGCCGRDLRNLQTEGMSSFQAPSPPSLNPGLHHGFLQAILEGSWELVNVLFSKPSFMKSSIPVARVTKRAAGTRLESLLRHPGYLRSFRIFQEAKKGPCLRLWKRVPQNIEAQRR